MNINSPQISPAFPCSSSSSSSSSSSTSSCSSSTSSLHSTISSTTSTINTTTVSPFHRCQGLDLLVKAVYHVDGSVIGVPYIQKRVIRRRKPIIRFDKLIVFPVADNGGIQEDCGNCEVIVVGKVKKLRKRSKKYQDSILECLKPNDRKRKRSSKSLI